jgi:hypothetical protein
MLRTKKYIKRNKINEIIHQIIGISIPNLFADL